MDIADFFMQVFDGTFRSKSEVRRAIKNGGFKINAVTVHDPFARILTTVHEGTLFGVLLEDDEQIITSFIGHEILRDHEPFEGFQ